MASGVLGSDGRWYFITYPFRSYDHREAYVELVDIGPVPARGTVARVEGVQGTGPRPEPFLVCPDGALLAELALALLAAGGVQPIPDDPDRPSPDPDHPAQERPRYQEAAQLLLQNARPVDPLAAGLVGIARVLLELSAERLGAPSSRAVLGDIVKNLVLGVENPDGLIPD